MQAHRCTRQFCPKCGKPMKLVTVSAPNHATTAATQKVVHCHWELTCHCRLFSSEPVINAKYWEAT